ncbi:MAG TPA: hypothetical protein VMZ69_09115 [Saprospiraceae bacterium]|nr:hypothetical protein [Saprospiraceae bacterium]
MEKENMSTMVSILEVLSGTGYTVQFKADSTGITSLTTNKMYKPDEVMINHFHRFEGESNPDDSSIVYAIETKSGEKGTLIDSYGAYTDTSISDFINKVKSIHK